MNVVAVVGPTASGKSSVAEAIAREFGAEILSVDSMQVYRGMDIGTAKPSREIRAEIVHHMVDIIDPSEQIAAAEFQIVGRNVLEASQRIVIAGGSGLHFRALVDPLTFAPTDAEIRAELEQTPFNELQQELLGIDHHAPDVLDIHNPRRVIRAVEVWRITATTPSERAATDESIAVREYEAQIPHVAVGIDAGDEIKTRVEERFAEMMVSGLLQEVEALAPTMGRTARQAVGYRQMLPVVESNASASTAFDEAVRATSGLVKRQRTFFRKDPRIEWIPWQDTEAARIDAAVTYVREATEWTS